MSNEIDKRVVQMEFDNKRFESNAATTMSTLEKLKQKLNFTGAAKGLETVGEAAKRVDVSGLGSAVETVQAKFSALQVVGVTALMNITNSAVNAGKQMIKSLSVDQITAGWSKYGQKTSSVQTIMNATGKSIDEVNKYLEKLMWFSDETSYGFTDMTSALGQMTSSGGDIEKLIPLITGVANATAYAGKGASEFSRVMYNLNQSYGAGYLQLMDWKSVELAGVGSKQLKQTIIDTAVQLGKIKEGQVTIGNFAETLKDKWADTEVMEVAFGKFGEFSDAVHAMVQSGEVDTAAEAISKLSSKYDELGVKAFTSAQEAKTFTEAIEATKDAVSSGWMKTFEIVFGNYEEAKVTWTKLANNLWDVFASGSESRNNILGNVFNSKWDTLNKRLEEAGISTSEFQNRLKKLAKEHNVDLDKMIKKEGSFEKALQKAFNSGKLDKSIVAKTLKSFVKDLTGLGKSTDAAGKSVKELGDIVNKVIRGDFGNGAERIKKLTEAGYDYATVQNLVNEKLGISKRHVSALTEEQLKNADSLADMTDAQLKAKGFTDEQIKAIRTLAEEADKAGSSINDLINSLDKPSGRELFLEALSNAAQAVIKPINAFKEAWNDAFSDEDKERILYNLIEGFNRFTEALIISDDAAANLKTVFTGLLDGFKLMHSVASMSVTGGLKILNAVLELFDMNILDAAALIASYITKLREWVDANTFLVNTFDKIGQIIYTVITGMKSLVDAFLGLSQVQAVIDAIKGKIKEWFGDMKSGLKIGGTLEAFNKTLENMFANLAAWIKSLDGLSPSEILAKLSGMLSKVKSSIANFGNDILEACPPLAKLVEILKSSIQAIKDWFGAFKDSSGVSGFLDILNNIFGSMGSRFEEAYEIGKNVIEGLVNGLKDGSMSIGTAIGTIINGLINMAKSILGIHSPSTVFFAIGGFIIAGLIGGMLGSRPNLKEALMSIGDTLMEFFKGLDIGTVMAGAISLGSFLMVRNALKIADKFADAAKGIAAFPKALGNLADTLNDQLIGKFKPSKWTIISNAIFKVAIAIGILAAAVILMAQVPTEKLWNAVGALAAIAGVVALLAGVMVGLMAATKLVAEGENVGKIGTMLLKLAAAVAIMVIVAKVASGMSVEDMLKASAAIVAFSGIMVGLIAATRLISESKNVGKIGSTLFKISAAIAMMVLVAKLAATMSWEDIVKGGAVITAFSGILVGLMAATKLINGSKNIGAMGGTLFKAAAAIAMMILVAKLAATMSWEDVVKGGLVISAFSGIMVGLMAATKLISGSKNVGAIGGALFKISAAIAIMIFVAKVAASMSEDEINKGTAAIVAFGGIMVGLMAATRLISGSKNIDEIGGSLFKIAAAIGIMVIVAKLASLMTIEDIAKGTMAISAFAGIIVGLMAATKLVSGSKNVDKIGNTILKVVGAIAAMAVMMVVLSLIPTDKLMGASAALSIVMGMFALILKAASTLNVTIKSIVTMVVIVGLLAGLMALLTTLDTDTSMEAAASISMLLLAMVGAMAVLDKLGNVSFKAIGQLAMITLIVAGLAGILALMSHFNVNPSIETASALSILLLSMSASLVILGIVGAMAGPALAGMGVLAVLIAGLGAVLVGLGALVDKFPKIEEFLNKGIPVLDKIGYALGSFFGNIIGGFAAGTTSGLPEMADNVSYFIDKIANSLSGVKMDSSVTEGVKAIAETILILTAADIMDGLTSWLTGGSSLSKFGEEIAEFAPHLKAYADTMKGIDIPSIEASTGAIKALAEMANAIPSQGGLMSIFTGENDLATFAKKLKPFGQALVDYSTSVDGTINTEAISTSVKAAKEVVKIADAIPETGGLVSAITGDNDLAVFGSKLVPFAQSLVGYSSAVTGTVDAEAIDASVKAAKKIIGIADVIPKSGGLVASITGDNDIAKFGTKMASFAVSLTKYSTTVSGMSTESVEASVSASKKLISLVKGIGDIDTGNIKSFKKAVDTLSKVNVDAFVKAFSGSTENIKSINSDMVSKIAEGIKSKVSLINEAGQTIADSFINTLKGNNKEFLTIGKEIVGKVAEGMGKNESDVTDAAKSMAKTAASETRDYYDNFHSAGSYLVSGFAAGITANTFKAEARAKAMAEAAEQAAKKALDINSPSKVFRKIGMSVPEGFAQGIDRLKGMVVTSSVSMSDSAIYAVQDSISRIADVINYDIESQPTIRPVLDLSNVTAGARSISGMFNMAPSVGVLANVGAINSMMNDRQNGLDNSDVVAAIEGLKEVLRDAAGDSYSIGDITYDDGSNVNNAVGALIQAIRMERRT